MLKEVRLSLIVLMMLGLVAVSCTDEQPPEDPVLPASSTDPATPPSDDGFGGGSVSSSIIYFSFDEYALTDSAKNTLGSLASTMKNSAGVVVQIEGHCDERGSIEYNLALGERRAQSVKNYLVQLGIDPARLTTISYGEEKPAVDGHNESAWSKNRRAEFVVSGQ